MHPASLLAVLLLPATAVAATPFDGTWTVSQHCSSTAEGVRGYSWTYPATIRDGVLLGIHTPASKEDGTLRLAGLIRSDGTALLTGDGQTGSPAFSVGHVIQGYTFHYTVTARFTPTAGTGTRNEQRPCDYAFTRH